jgi:hypothetical protein
MNNDFNVMAWLWDHAWTAFIALGGLVWKQNRAAMEAQRLEAANALKAHMEEDQRTIHSLLEEQSIQRSHIGKIFDKIESHSLRAEDRHHELLKALHEGLRSKADK